MSKIELNRFDGSLKIARAMVERLDILNYNIAEQNGLLLRVVLALEEWNNCD